MLKRTLPTLILLAVFLSACGAAPEAPPTMAPVDMQNTAVAAAWTMVQATNDAIPTNTALPPTEVPSPTPLPTSTPDALLMPTLIPTLSMPTATQPSAASGDCNGPLNVGEAGPLKNVRIENTTAGTATLSLHLDKNLFGQCGYIGYVVKPGQKLRVGIPAGTWWAFAWLEGKFTGQVGGAFYMGPSKTNDLLRLIIKEQVIAWVGP